MQLDACCRNINHTVCMPACATGVLYANNAESLAQDRCIKLRCF